MKKILSALLALLITYAGTFAQSWNLTGNAAISSGINYLGTSDPNDLVFRTNAIERGRLLANGQWRFGSTTNYAAVDNTGKFTFTGTGAYYVGANKYAFQYAGAPNYGLFFNSSAVQYEFRNGSAVPVFYVNANNGNGVFNGTLRIGAYTLPSADGINGQVLKTNGSGILSWNADNSATYTAGTGVSITSNVINNTGDVNAFDDITSTTVAGGDLGGTYPNPGVNKIKGVTVSANTPANGQVLKYNSANLQWEPSADDNTTYTAGSGIGISGSIITNTLPDQAITLNNGTGISITGSYPAFTIGSTVASSQWTTAGSNVYYNTGNVGIGTSTPLAKLQVSGGDALINGINVGAGGGSIVSNTVVGSGALNSNITGYSNVAIGINALFSSTISDNQVAIGDSALYNSNAVIIPLTKPNNTAVGSKALYSTTSGKSNTANGYQALYLNTTGSGNTAYGVFALDSNTIGTNNTACGYDAGDFYSNNSNSTFLGYDADYYINGNPSGVNNSMALGNGARVNTSNQVRIGNSSVTSIGGYTTWSSLSDGRIKKSIKENVPGLIFINKLKPVTYHLDISGIRNILGEGSEENKMAEKNINQKEKILYTGFVAQEVEKAAKELDYEFSGVDAPENKDGLYALRYAEFVVPLVKAVQELSKANDAKDKSLAGQQIINAELQRQNDLQQQQINSILQKLNELQTVQQQCCIVPGMVPSENKKSITLSGASLEQNIPNPFNSTTTINYSLPQTYSSAKIIVVDKAGKTLRAINVSGSGKGSLQLDASTLASGAYNYTLYVDGKLIDTKQMEHIK